MTQFQAQMMLLAGMVILGWVMVRRQIRRRRSQRSESLRLQRLEAPAPARGAPLADAPRSVLRWQAAMFDLQRDLTAELDTRIAVVQALLRQADEKLERLEGAVEAPGASPAAGSSGVDRSAEPSACGTPQSDSDGRGASS